MFGSLLVLVVFAGTLSLPTTADGDGTPPLSVPESQLRVAKDWPYCRITLPHNGMDDIQTAAEYVVYAIRHVARMAGRKVDVGLAPSNHGTVLANRVCAPAFWQQRAGSAFMTALNSGQETWAGIDYTTFDEVVASNLDDNGSSSLYTGKGRISNVGLQEVCPVRVADHSRPAPPTRSRTHGRRRAEARRTC